MNSEKLAKLRAKWCEALLASEDAHNVLALNVASSSYIGALESQLALVQQYADADRREFMEDLEESYTYKLEIEAGWEKTKQAVRLEIEDLESKLTASCANMPVERARWRELERGFHKEIEVLESKLEDAEKRAADHISDAGKLVSHVCPEPSECAAVEQEPI